MEQVNIFSQLPDHVVIAALVDADGQYSVHVKLNEQGEYATFRKKLDEIKALALADHLMHVLGLPDEAAYMDGWDDIQVSTFAVSIRLSKRLAV